MLNPMILLKSSTPMRATKIVLDTREPTHPAVVARSFRKGQRPSDFALVVQTARPVLALHHARVDLRVSEQRADMRETGCAPDHLQRDPIGRLYLMGCEHLAIGQPQWPAQYGPRRTPLGVGFGSRIAPAKGSIADA